jgi:hypothetical protein
LSDHPVGWAAQGNTQNRQCSCGFFHPSPFFSGGNFFLVQRYVLIEIEAFQGASYARLRGWQRSSGPEELWISN